MTEPGGGGPAGSQPNAREPDAPEPDAPRPIASNSTPLVAWEAPAPATAVSAAGAGSYAGGPPPFTVGAILSDTFARYGADFLRLFLVAAAGSTLSWVGSFAAPAAGSNPFARPTGFVDVSGLLGLAGFVVGIVGSATLLALAEGGGAVPFGRALRRGVERSGWVFLTSLLLGVAFVVVFLLALIPIGLFALISPILAAVPVLALFLVFVWVGLRLALALPANVADNLNSIEAVKLSWRVTKPSGVWLRVLGASLLLGLLVAPAAIGAMLLVFPAMFASMFGGGGTQLALLLLPAIAFAVFTPLFALLTFSAYRRLVPPLQPSWTAPPGAAPTPVAGIDAPPPLAADGSTTPAAPAVPSPAAAAPLVPWGDPAATAPPAWTAASSEPSPTIAPPGAGPAPVQASPVPVAAPAFRVPRLGTAGKGLIALMLAFDVAGIVAIPYGVAQLERLGREGLPGFPGSPGLPAFPGGAGSVFPGQVAFGTQADLDTCTIEGQLSFTTTSAQVEWVAALEQRATPQDEVFLRITRNGQELETTLQDPGTYDCLGSEAPEPGLVEGVYTYEVLVNGMLSSTGSLFVQ